MAKLKSEKKVTIGNAEYCLKFSFAALSEAEEHLDMSVIEILAYLSGGRARIKHLVFIFRQVLMAGGHEVSEKDTMDLAEDFGYEYLVDAVIDAITYAFPDEETGGKKPKKAKA